MREDGTSSRILVTPIQIEHPNSHISSPKVRGRQSPDLCNQGGLLVGGPASSRFCVVPGIGTGLPAPAAARAWRRPAPRARTARTTAAAARPAASADGAVDTTHPAAAVLLRHRADAATEVLDLRGRDEIDGQLVFQIFFTQAARLRWVDTYLSQLCCLSCTQVSRQLPSTEWGMTPMSRTC